MIGPRIVELFNWPFLVWSSCFFVFFFLKTAFPLLCICYMCYSSNSTLLLLRGGGGCRKGGSAPEESYGLEEQLHRIN